MKNRFLFVFGAGLAATLAVTAPAARAQQNMGTMAPNAMAPGVAVPNPGDTNGARLSAVVSVDANNLASLPTLTARAGAISLGVYAADLDKDPAARDALLSYVSGGGTVFLHTDAAQLFGYRTVAARAGTSRLAGQLYGRARAAVPFGTVPLLSDGGATTPRGARLPGVNTVFYTLRAGDDLVVSHPDGTPLLQVTDLAAPPRQPLYAAAIAPFGAGWAVFTPDTIDTRRADGAAFARNLLKLVGDSRYVGVSQAAILSGDGLLQSLADALLNGTSAALPGLGAEAPVAREGTMPNAPVARDAQDDQAAMPAQTPVDVRRAQGPVLLLTRNEARAFGQALQTDPNGRGAVALALLRARVALLGGDAQAAREQIAIASRIAPDAGDLQYISGIVAVSDAINGTVFNAGQRSQAANIAANAFAAAGGARPYFAQVPGTTGVEFGAFSGVQLNDLGAQLNRFSQVLALEPPLALTVGNGPAAITIRYFEGDSSLPFAQIVATKLANSALFGWSVDGQEILLFPTPAIYANYRRAMGLTQQNVPLAPQVFGDVVDGRILMVSIPAARPVTRLPNGQIRVLPLRPTTAILLARFEAYALLEGYLGNGNGRVPAWLTLGLVNILDTTINGDALVAQYDQELRRVALVNGLLAPAQFNAQLVQPTVVAQAQATDLVRYLYAQFGPGSVAETVQRLGAGESIDDALRATTGLDEQALFRTWRDARFGTLLNR